MKKLKLQPEPELAAREAAYEEDNALITLDGDNVTTDLVAVEAISKGTAYLPLLKLMTANSGPCKDGEFPTNHYALESDGKRTDLGPEVDVLIIAARTMAIDSSDEEALIVTYDPKLDEDGKPTGEFARIMAEADKPGMNGCMYGPQYLVWIPCQQTFATYFMGSKTARRASAHVNARLLKGATLGARKIESKDFTWFGPTCVPCSTITIPDKAELEKQVEVFRNPPVNEVERVEESDEGGRER